MSLGYSWQGGRIRLHYKDSILFFLSLTGRILTGEKCGEKKEAVQKVLRKKRVWMGTGGGVEQYDNSPGVTAAKNIVCTGNISTQTFKRGQNSMQSIE